MDVTHVTLLMAVTDAARTLLWVSRHSPNDLAAKQSCLNHLEAAIQKLELQVGGFDHQASLDYYQSRRP